MKDYLQVIKESPILASLSEAKINDLFQQSTVKYFKKGEWVFEQGDVPNSLYIIAGGDVEILGTTDKGEFKLADFSTGSTFGEMGIIDGKPRSAGVKVTSETLEIIQIDKSVILSAYDNQESIFQSLTLMSERLRNSNHEIEKRFLQLAETNLKLQEPYMKTVLALSQALEMRDKVTGGHSERVTAYSLLIAESMGIDETSRENLRLGSLLHDIGKIGITDLILNKKGKLTDEEFDTMKTHASLGKSIIEPIDFLKDSIDVVSCHHEKWNGKGYPFGLSGEDIPLHARIFAISDVFDALTMERPYKSAWSADEAKAEIIRSSGSHFDPNAVEHFEKIYDKILSILNRSKAGEKINVTSLKKVKI